MLGRGQLGKWGPNHAADPVVTRWKRDDNGQIFLHPKTNKPVLQFVSIQRLDTNAWAIPGVSLLSIIIYKGFVFIKIINCYIGNVRSR